MAGQELGALIDREVLGAYKNNIEVRVLGEVGDPIIYPISSSATNPPTGKPPKPYGGALGALGYQGK